MSKLLNIRYNGDECEVIAYASYAEDLPDLLCRAGNATNALLLDVEGPDDAETATDSPVCCASKAAAPCQANGQIIAAIGALIQKAIANAPALIAEIQTLAPEIEALIALFGKTPSTAA